MARFFAAALILFCLIAGLAYADGFSDFRIPKHRVYSVTGSVNGGYNGYHSERSPYTDVLARMNGRLTGSGYWLQDSDPLRAYLRASLSGSGERETWDSQLEPQSGAEFLYRNADGTRRNLSESWSLSAELRHYPWTFPLGWEIGASGSAGYGQMWSTSSTEEFTTLHSLHSSNNEHNRSYSYHASGNAVLGFGRVRDASPVYTLYLIEQRLVESGALTGPLSEATRQKLHAVFYVQKDYLMLRDRGEKFFWREIENILRQDGALRDAGLDAFDIYRIIEPMIGPFWAHSPREPYALTSQFVRQTGMFVGAKVRQSHYNRIYHRQIESTSTVVDTAGIQTIDHAMFHTREQYFSDDVAVGVSFEYHRPLGMKWQIDLASDVLFPIDDAAHALDASTDIAVNYLIADRWAVAFDASHYRMIWRYSNPGDGMRDAWSIGGYLNAAYYIEDRVALNLSIGHSQYSEDGNDYIDRDYRHDNSVSLGLTYHFLGALDAPGLGLAERLLPVRF